MAGASLLRDSEPKVGFFRLNLAPYSIRKPTLRSFDRFGQHGVGSRFTLSGLTLLHRYVYKPKSIVASGYQADCYKLHLSCILASIPERAYSPLLREAKSRVLLKRSRLEG
jgi:hypothetical protein